jgi:hypothetical protein
VLVDYDAATGLFWITESPETAEAKG